MSYFYFTDSNIDTLVSYGYNRSKLNILIDMLSDENNQNIMKQFINRKKNIPKYGLVYENATTLYNLLVLLLEKLNAETGNSMKTENPTRILDQFITQIQPTTIIADNSRRVRNRFTQNTGGKSRRKRKTRKYKRSRRYRRKNYLN
jgi:hypothetical protein